jgi:large subunit ribosomal protein L19
MGRPELLKFAEGLLNPMPKMPVFKAGDTITVHYKIREGNKERIQQFQGVVLQRSGEAVSATFTVRKMSGNIGVERIFPITSPNIDKIVVNKKGHVRRARIFYLRDLTGKKAKIREKRVIIAKTEEPKNTDGQA